MSSIYHQSFHFSKTFKGLGEAHGQPAKFLFGQCIADTWENFTTPFAIMRRWKVGTSHFISTDIGMGGGFGCDYEDKNYENYYGKVDAPYEYFYEIKPIAHHKETKDKVAYSEVNVRVWEMSVDVDDLNEYGVVYDNCVVKCGDVSFKVVSEWTKEEVFKGNDMFYPTMGYNMYPLDKQIAKDLLSDEPEAGEGWTIAVGYCAGETFDDIGYGNIVW